MEKALEDIRTLDLASSQHLNLDTVSSNVYVVWANGDENVAFKASTNNGASFGSTKILSSDGNSSGPQISSLGNAVRIVWEGVPQILMYSLGQVEMREIPLVVSRI